MVRIVPKPIRVEHGRASKVSVVDGRRNGLILSVERVLMGTKVTVGGVVEMRVWINPALQGSSVIRNSRSHTSSAGTVQLGVRVME